MSQPKTPYACPICHAAWRGNTNQCASCGADLYDPDVQAMAGATAGAPGASQNMPGIASGTLSVGRFLGVSPEGIADGSTLRRYGLFGGISLLVAFVLPALRTVHREFAGTDPSGNPIIKTASDFTSSWTLLAKGPALALLFPLVAGLLGLAVAFVPRLSRDVRAKLLALCGLAGLVLCVGKLGQYGMAPESLLSLSVLGMVVAGIGMTARMLTPRSDAARWVLIAGAALVVVGYLIPIPDLAARLPLEFQFRPGQLDLDLSNAMPLTAIAGGMKKISYGGRSGFAVEVLFVAFFLLLPLVATPAAAWLSWRKQSGVWDKSGHALRPLAWFIVLYLPLSYALYTFNASGWDNEGAASAMFGRARLLFIVTPLALWAQFGLYAAVAGRFQETSAARPVETMRGEASSGG